MGTGWRRAFCTTIRRDADSSSPVEPQSSPSPKTGAKLSFFRRSRSSPSTPRLQHQTQSRPSTPTLRCRTQLPTGFTDTGATERATLQSQSSATALLGEPTTPGSYRQSWRPPFVSSNPSSPRSPSRLALLLRNNLRFTRSRCGICLQSVRTGKGTAIFTAECSHAFHFQCIASDVRNQKKSCPICSSVWRQVPFLSSVHAEENQKQQDPAPEQGKLSAAVPRKADTANSVVGTKVYDDDEPFLNNATACFHPIPEAEDEYAEGEIGDGVAVAPSPSCTSPPRRQHAANCALRVTSSSDVALLSVGRVHENHVVALKVKSLTPVSNTAATAAAAPLLDPSRRAPIDLVTVLDVGTTMTGAKLQMLKRAMRLVVSSLGPCDRLSIVAISASSAKRLLPLRRMSPDGQRSARRIVERLICVEGSSAREGLRKAVKVLEDRRESNPVAAVVLLTDSQQHKDDCSRRRRECPSSHTSYSARTRFAHLEVPIHESGFGAEEHQEHAEDSFARCVGGLLSVVCHDVRLELSFPSGEVCSVYSSGSRPNGDMYAGEERELLVELRMNSAVLSAGAFQPLLVSYSYRNPATQELVHGGEHTLPVFLTRRQRPAAAPKVEHLRNVFITARAIAEAQRLADNGDFATGLHLLASARRLLLECSSICPDENLRAVEAELQELRWRQQRRNGITERPTPSALENSAAAEALTPMSAWRAAERLAKLAIMRKSLNRVSDLHGFENARF
ncbi:unnamed protein product [Spirodela intermedia]|uniref:Uncharacterized protein n=1 Tax=Spirodela intermedia TaxID=51605 RepID=A0A7I8I8M9_SPIIN|nr:unnamed protein product [Spirodela intermedia]CAA6653412.1 unnamed protein product [Spirodela intermedia]